MLTEYTELDDVENVLLYISDSVRWDSLSEPIDELGVTAKTITPSTFTGSSLPSLITSTYPIQHRVWNFSSKLDQEPYVTSIDINFGVDVSEVWGEDYSNDQKPTLDLINIASHTDFDPSYSSFFHIIHDHGGHAPYGRETNSFKSSREFFEEYQGDSQEIAQLYQKGVNESAGRFRDLRNQLQSEGKLDQTLLIYTSDHGEILGEYGEIFGHSNPMVPELVTVPTVFCGAGLTNDVSFDRLISSLDILPTALAALGEKVPRQMEGMNLWNRDQERNDPIFCDVWKPSRFDRIHYKASSMWSETGGIVFNHSPKLSRLAFSIGHHYYLAPYATLMRKSGVSGLQDIVECYSKKVIEFGDYSGSGTTDLLKNRDFSDGGTVRSDVNEELLRNLGYVE